MTAPSVVAPPASVPAVSFDEAATLNDKTGLPVAVGRLYAAVNPAWPGIVKIGSSGDLSKRLSDYQTASPYRDYRMVAFSQVFQDVKRAEFQLHADLIECKVDGSREWFKLSEMAIVALFASLGGEVVEEQSNDDWYDE